jgi:Protein of unknown function (DUF3891)
VNELVLRGDERGVIAIGQASHAWISGQLARAWGNAQFGPLEPREEVCLGAEQHDVGMAQWDLTPALDRSTGLPQSLTEMPLGVHLELWRAGRWRLVSQSRYAALLVAMHGRRLYEHRKLDELAPAQADLVRLFIKEQRDFEQRLLASLRADPATASFVDPEVVARNSQLLSTWDGLSLALCLDWAPYAAHEVPTAGGPVDLQLSPCPNGDRCALDPWPFACRMLTVRCEGVRLTDRFMSEEALRRGLERAPSELVEFELVPAGP